MCAVLAFTDIRKSYVEQALYHPLCKNYEDLQRSNFLSTNLNWNDFYQMLNKLITTKLSCLG